MKHRLILAALLLSSLTIRAADVPKFPPSAGNATNFTVFPARPIFEIVSVQPAPVIQAGDEGTEGNKYGFEGGCVFRRGNVYQMFVAEMCGDPRLVKMRLAHWQSPDGIKWERVCTLYESSGEFEGKDPRASLWAPMPVYDEEEGRWNMFYVAYRSKPNTPKGWFLNYEGRIWRAVATTAGPEGYGGPYRDIGVVLEPGPDCGPWEGLQGTDSFYPYQAVDGRWFGFFGSAQTQRPKPNNGFPSHAVGLATAEKLAGPWHRCNDRNPLILHPQFVENPVVTRLDDGLFVAAMDAPGGSLMGYSVSDDGASWSRAALLDIPQTTKGCWQQIRTPLGLIPEADGSFTVFFTAFSAKNYGTVGRAVLRRIE